jgi:hypothetical protein
MTWRGILVVALITLSIFVLMGYSGFYLLGD